VYNVNPSHRKNAGHQRGFPPSSSDFPQAEIGSCGEPKDVHRAIDLAKHISPRSIVQRLRDWSQGARQIIDLRLALVVGLLAFVLVVSLDSAGNSAQAADLTNPVNRPSIRVTVAVPQAAGEAESTSTWNDPVTARRLNHGLMTSPLMTSNRLTNAHFFTDLPTEE